MHFSEFNMDQASSYLAALIDGEGCVYYRRINKTHGGDKTRHSRVVTITNTDKELIDAASHCMDVLGIEYGKITHRQGATSGRKEHWTIEVRKGPAMARLRDAVPIQTIRKRDRLDEALESYRGLHCAGCGCLHDEATEGCLNCRKRHYFREATRRHRGKVISANDNAAPAQAGAA